MPNIQTRDAIRVLGLIAQAVANGELLTYWKAAIAMDRMPPQNHVKTVAQMCDLLDAAACLAGTPLLALVAVREKSGKINPKAWKEEYGPRRDAIIARSQGYKFGKKDFIAIRSAIDDLGGRGNVKSWEHLRDIYPGDLLFRRLVGEYIIPESDAINDLGTDAPVRELSQSWSYPRDPKVRDAVLSRTKGRCEFCGAEGFLKPDGSRYVETHHIIALAAEGADRATNVIGLCPNDHKEAHFGEQRAVLEEQMIAKLAAIIAA
ncbi:MAG: HNH endonuclease signature motif containing protein [Acidobacteriaceae bacterium]